MTNPRLFARGGLLAGCFLLAGAMDAQAAGEFSPIEGTVCPSPPAWMRIVAVEDQGSATSVQPEPTIPAPSTRAGPERDLSYTRVAGIPVQRSSAWKPMFVGQGAVGVILHATVRDPSFSVSLEMRGPHGESLACRGCEDAPVVGEEKVFRGSVHIPSTNRPGSELLPGTYQYRVNALLLPGTSHNERSSTTADVTISVRSNAGDVVEHFLDLNFIYLPGIPLDAQIASTTPEFAEFLQLAEAELAPLGIQFGEISHIDLARPEFTNLGSWQEAAQLLMETSSGVGRPRALNVYCVSFFEGELLNAAGLAGGIPGPGLNGTRDSGVALRIAPSYPNFLPAYGKLLAHEIGHFLGFYHTTEADLTHEDPLSDTPRCESPDLHACPDWTNHMFPIVNMDQTVWSPAQIAIGKTHAIVRTVAVDARAASGAGAAAASANEALRARPNPFVDRVELVGRRGPFEILNVSGRRVRSLPSSESAAWDGRDAQGHAVPPGVYFVRALDGGSEPSLRLIRAQ